MSSRDLAPISAAAPHLSGGLPLFEPPYGQITAIDLGKGEIIWQVPHGETPDEIRNSPLLKGLNIPRTGRPGIIGVADPCHLPGPDYGSQAGRPSVVAAMLGVELPVDRA